MSYKNTPIRKNAVSPVELVFGEVVIGGEKHYRIIDVYEEINKCKQVTLNAFKDFRFGYIGSQFPRIDIIVAVFGTNVQNDNSKPENYKLCWVMNDNNRNHIAYLYEVNADDLYHFNGNDADELYKIIFKNKPIGENVEEHLIGKVVHFIGEKTFKIPDNENDKSLAESYMQAEDKHRMMDRRLDTQRHIDRRFAISYMAESSSVVTGMNKELDTSNSLSKNMSHYVVGNKKRPTMFPPKGISQGGRRKRTKRSKRTKHHYTKKR
jgi:hypothetical protein